LQGKKQFQQGGRRMALCDIFDLRSIKVNLEGITKDAIFTELIEAIRLVHPEYGHDEMFAALQTRENKMSTGIASGVALPHGYCQGVTALAGSIGISQSGIEYKALDNKPVYVVFMLVMGEPAQENHLRVLNQIFSLVKSEAMPLIKAAKDPREIHDILSRVH
jgi:mannitol/fructose-specific phosphotransferase system IIA component (Ntr-type)